MTVVSGNNAPKTRGRLFPPGNPGRPRGARHKTTLLAQRLMQCEAQAIVSVVVEAAKDTVEAAAGRSECRAHSGWRRSLHFGRPMDRATHSETSGHRPGQSFRRGGMKRCLCARNRREHET